MRATAILISIAASLTLLSCEKRCRPIAYESESNDAVCFQLQTNLALHARDGNLAGVQKAVNDGANVNGSADNWMLPLTLVASHGHDTIAEYLLSQGADIDATPTGIGATPLTAAITSHHPTTVKLLISHGANVCLKTESMTPIMVAGGDRSSEIVQLLIAAGADKCPNNE